MKSSVQEYYPEGLGTGMSMTVTWGPGIRRRALAVLAAFGLLASLITVFSPPALGEGKSPSTECSSTIPAWNGDFWKVEKDDGTLSDVETNVTGAITLAASGSWTNNNDDPVFRIVLKIDGDDDDDDDDDDNDVQVLSGMWETGEGGTIDMTLGLDHVTFCSTSEVSEEPEPTTTSTISTTTTSTGATATTSAGPTTTTSPPDATPGTTPGESPPSTASGATTTNAAANPVEVSDSGLASDASQADESVEAADGSELNDGDLSPEADRDTTAAGPMNGGPGEPPALGQELSSNAVPDVFRSPHQWTLVDLAILAALIAATAILLERRRLRRLLGHLGKRWR